MKITNVTPVNSMIIETDEIERCHYTRYGPDCWYARIYQTDEPVWNPKELEEAYQEYIISKVNAGND